MKGNKKVSKRLTDGQLILSHINRATQPTRININYLKPAHQHSVEMRDSLVDESETQYIATMKYGEAFN